LAHPHLRQASRLAAAQHRRLVHRLHLRRQPSVLAARLALALHRHQLSARPLPPPRRRLALQPRHNPCLEHPRRLRRSLARPPPRPRPLLAASASPPQPQRPAAVSASAAGRSCLRGLHQRQRRRRSARLAGRRRRRRCSRPGRLLTAAALRTYRRSCSSCSTACSESGGFVALMRAACRTWRPRSALLQTRISCVPAGCDRA
jgi:hypothetical protein